MKPTGRTRRFGIGLEIDGLARLHNSPDGRATSRTAPAAFCRVAAHQAVVAPTPRGVVGGGPGVGAEVAGAGLGWGHDADGLPGK
jgi:hypothetical protein